MDTYAELSQERAVLVKADIDIRLGQNRILEQQDAILEQQRKGRESREAERFLHLLRRTLVQWQEHRTLILLRIHHLETRLAAEAKPKLSI